MLPIPASCSWWFWFLYLWPFYIAHEIAFLVLVQVYIDTCTSVSLLRLSKRITCWLRSWVINSYIIAYIIIFTIRYNLLYSKVIKRFVTFEISCRNIKTLLRIIHGINLHREINERANSRTFYIRKWKEYFGNWFSTVCYPRNPCWNTWLGYFFSQPRTQFSLK